MSEHPPPRPPARRCSAAFLPFVASFFILLTFSGCSAHRYAEPTPGGIQRGLASWYGEPFHGRLTAGGETYDMHGLTAAHRDLPLGTLVKVTNLDNGRSVRVRINDRGPFVRGRILDLSYGAAQALGMVQAGVARVEIVVVAESQRLATGTHVRGRHYGVQVGAFREATYARDLQVRLAREHDDVELVSGDGWFRVRVGRFLKRADAEKLARQLRHSGLTAILVALP